MSRIAITGTASYLGSRILRRLVESRGADRVVTVDITPPPTTLHGVRYRMVDLTLPGADQRLVDVFREEQVDTVVHAAFFTTPRRDAAYSHELESIGTLHLAAAAAAGGSGTCCCARSRPSTGRGARTPTSSARSGVPTPTAARLGARQGRGGGARVLLRAALPALGVTVLRFATLLGPGVHTFYTRMFSKRVVPFVLGYDPLVQLLHPDDALGRDAALAKGPAASSTCSAQHAVAAHDPAPRREAHRRRASRGGLPAGRHVVGRGPRRGAGGFVDYVRFPFVGDGEKARRELGFVPARAATR